MITTLLQILAGFLGTISFAILFEVPRCYYVHCGVIGACGWAIYLLIMHFWVAPVAATFIASMALIYLSREASFALKAPVVFFALFPEWEFTILLIIFSSVIPSKPHKLVFKF